MTSHFSGEGLVAGHVLDAPVTDQPALALSGVSKAFGGTPALIDVDFEVFRGEVHALLGQNGSGKSTLVKILAGYHRPDAGGAMTYGRELSLGNTHSAKAAGIRFVHQDLGLVDTLSTVENLALGRGYRGRTHAWISWRSEAAHAVKAIETIGYEFNVRRPVGELAASERVGVAVARALQDWDEPTSVLVLDEPTAAMPAPEVRRFFGMVERVRAAGVAVIFISHRIEEVMEIANRVTVLRDGAVIATHSIGELDDTRLVQLIVGQALDAGASTRVARQVGENVLEVRSVSAGELLDASFTVGRGEIVGIAGLAGSGRHAVAPLLFGAIPRRSGEVIVAGKPLPSGRTHASARRGVGMIPADRKRLGMLAGLSVLENLTIAGVRRNASSIRVRRRRERRDVVDWMTRFDVRPSKPDAPMWTLSGGNQQKVILARWVKLAPKLLLLDEPTQGVDVGAKEQIYELVEQAAQDGLAVVLCSSDTDELDRLCDRVFVLCRGYMSVELQGDQVTKSAIDHAVLAVAPANSE